MVWTPSNDLVQGAKALAAAQKRYRFDLYGNRILLGIMLAFTLYMVIVRMYHVLPVILTGVGIVAFTLWRKLPGVKRTLDDWQATHNSALGHPVRNYRVHSDPDRASSRLRDFRAK